VRAALVGNRPADVAARLLDRFGRPLTNLAVTIYAGACDISLTPGSLESGDCLCTSVRAEATSRSITMCRFVWAADPLR
jgi:hypothetical protein